ncbi:OLC1v1021989C3 [Oldenlandia corymbosa var. corymbosa]|uniref:OLC1v1021989C3 n=1 Tax=Oldenlandia corymbosa var. corymbosa TaxID=529605 RepID=A0AAV1BWV0_OLDCO|nr:OLC1v1021989C3 [Oldenlandia corymbosa var. corymbosa]
MAFFRSLLKTLASQSTKSTRRNSNSSPDFRTFFSLSSATAQPFANRSPAIVRDPIFSLHRHYFLRRNFLSPLSLSSPLWKLSQYATPVHLQSDIVLLRLPTVRDSLRLPYRLGFQLAPEKVLEEERKKEDRELTKSHHINDSDAADSVADVTRSYLNLPNFISFGRLLSGPLLGWMITQEMYVPAFVGLGISGATDWLDGYLARKMKINSVVGSYLDPLADKVLIGCVALGMVDRGLLHPGLVALVVLRDVALIGGAVYKRASSLEWQWKSWSDFFNLDGAKPEKVEPLFISKVNTVLQLVLVAGALLQPELGNEETLSYITYLSWFVALTTLGSTAAYGAQHIRTGSKLKYRL